VLFSDDFYITTDGLVMGTGGLVRSFDVSFDQDVELVSYTTKFHFITSDQDSRTLDITGPGVNSLNYPFVADAPFDSGGLLTLQANEPYHFLFGITSGSGGTSFATWNLQAAAVPEPTTLAIWGTLGGLGLIVARRRKRVA
jgi:hypothetical protein